MEQGDAVNVCVSFLKKTFFTFFTKKRNAEKKKTIDNFPTQSSAIDRFCQNSGRTQIAASLT